MFDLIHHMEIKTPKLLACFLNAIILTACSPDKESDNNAPIVNAGEDFEIREGETASFSGSASDTDGQLVSFLWTHTSGASVTINNSSSPEATFTAPNISSQETISFQLTATDDDGDSATDSINVTVIPNIFPTVTAGDDFEENEREIVTLSGSASDEDGEIASYLWTQTSGPTVTIDNSDSINASFLSPETSANETLTFQLSATDNDGDTSIGTVSVTISPVVFEITLSDNIDRCGNFVEEDIDISIISDSGNTETTTITHSGPESIYRFGTTDNDPRTIKIEKPTRDLILVDVAPSQSLFVALESEPAQTCDCPVYTITLINEPSSSSSNTKLWANKGVTHSPSQSGSSFIWSDIEICESETSSVYIINSEDQKSSQIIVDSNTDITINGLEEMDFTLLNGDFPNITTDSNLWWENISNLGFSYQSRGQFSELIIDTEFSDNNVNDGIIHYPNYNDISDQTVRMRFPVDYVNYNSSGAPAFHTGSSLLFTDALEQHSIRGTVSSFSDGFNFDAFEFEAVDISVSPELMLLDAVGELPFESVMMFNYNGSKWTDITAPIENGRVDFSKIDNTETNFSGLTYVFIVDFPHLDEYQDSLSFVYNKKTSGESAQSRSIYLIWQ